MAIVGYLDNLAQTTAIATSISTIIQPNNVDELAMH